MLDRVEEIRTELIPPREQQVDDILAKAREEYDDPWDIPNELEARYERLQAQVKNLRGEANTLEHYAEEWNGDEFVIRELSVGGVGMIQDDVAEASGVDMQGGGTPKGGYARRRSLEVSVKDKPPGSPDIENFPDAVGDWLYEAVDEFNTTGEVDLGNSSLRADLMDSET